MSKARILILLFLASGLVLAALALRAVISMPGKSFSGSVKPANEQEKDIEVQLRKHVQVLGADIGQRNTAESLDRSIKYIESTMDGIGYKTEEQEFFVNNLKCKNLECTLQGSSPEILLVGAHYDSVSGSTGADDNGSGVAATMEIARLCARKKLSKTIKFVFFCNEEPPFFSSKEMGSYFYLQHLLQNHERVCGLIVLETLGYYTDMNNSQVYPVGFAPGYPTTGNFVAFVGNLDYKKITERCVDLFRQNCRFPSEGIAAPNWVEGIDWSDQFWFWKNGIPAVMVTDTAPYRYPYYHTMQDTPDKLNYPAFARVVSGLSMVVEKLAN